MSSAENMMAVSTSAAAAAPAARERELPEPVPGVRGVYVGGDSSDDYEDDEGEYDDDEAQLEDDYEDEAELNEDEAEAAEPIEDEDEAEEASASPLGKAEEEEEEEAPPPAPPAAVQVVKRKRHSQATIQALTASFENAVVPVYGHLSALKSNNLASPSVRARYYRKLVDGIDALVASGELKGIESGEAAMARFRAAVVRAEDDANAVLALEVKYFVV